ncbi:MAG: DUF4417 domain-containing protein [Ruminococcus sp.]|nr:DUF4417 domain-containing protein [Ruminococcus sp.]
MVHFFLDDYKFEVIWNDPLPRVEKLKSHKAVLAPNFSVYTEMPMAMKIYNTFRSRWCGAYLQSNGVKVIPTLAWGGPETFWFCFDGIPKNSVVAVSTVGVRTEKDLFMQGYNEMLRRIKPSKIICYGKSFEDMKGDIIEIDYAKTNNLDKTADTSYGFIKKTVGYVLPCSEKGMGSAGIGTATWANPDTLKDHFDRHAKAFSVTDELSYEQQAHRFYLDREKYQIKIDENGVIRVYDTGTNTFGVYNSNGKTITFFKPSHGQRYFDSQPGKLQ